jgi:hypothetical protein
LSDILVTQPWVGVLSSLWRGHSRGLAGIAAAVLLALGLGFLARRGVQMGLEQWTVAGRSFGAPLVFLRANEFMVERLDCARSWPAH